MAFWTGVKRADKIFQKTQTCNTGEIFQTTIDFISRGSLDDNTEKTTSTLVYIYDDPNSNGRHHFDFQESMSTCARKYI